jgi:hypothetical protein
MRKILMIASAAAMAISMPAVAKKGEGGGGGGGKPEKHQGGGGHGGGGGGEKRGGGGEGRGGGWERGGGDHKRFEEGRKHAEKRFEEQRKSAEKRREERGKRWEQERKHAEKSFEQRSKWAEKRREERGKRLEERRKWAEKDIDKRGERAWKREEKRAERFEGRREFRRVSGEDRYETYGEPYRQRYALDTGGACPPGLARKNNGCLPPGHAKKMFGPAQFFTAGQVLPLEYYSEYNVPYEYQSWYQDNPDNYYRYDDDGYIYQVDRQSNLIESLIPLLGGGFGVGQLLPAGYDSYNLPMQYRDDFQDSDEAYYRYGDDAIYQVDPQTNMIESIVALLGGDLNVGSMLPSGYDTYNLPMEYRDQYVDDADSMYRYADGNIYEVDPQTQIIEQIVASLV